MSGDVWTFDAEVGPMLNKIRQINNEQQLLERQIKQNAETARRGSALAQQAVEQDLTATYKLTQQKKQLFTELKKLEDQQQKAVVTQQVMNTGASKSQMAIQQLAYAADDAAASFSTGGFAGAMRGAANNLSMVAMMINPLYGALTGVGLAIGGVFVRNMEKASEAVDKHKVKTKELLVVLKELDERALKASKGNEEAARILQQQTDQKLINDAREKKAGARTKVVAAQAALRDAEARATQVKGAGGGKFGQVAQQGAILRVNQARRALDDAQQEEKGADIELAALTNKVNQAQQAEGRQRLGAFNKDFQKKFEGFQADFGKALVKRVKQFDPLNRQIEGQELNVRRARMARDEFELANPRNADDRGREGQRIEKMLEMMDRNIKNQEIILNRLKLQKEEREQEENQLPQLNRNAGM